MNLHTSNNSSSWVIFNNKDIVHNTSEAMPIGIILHSETTHSLLLSNSERNQWYNFATGEHGDIIDLVCTLQHCSIAEAMKHLSSASNTSVVSSSTRAAPSFSFGGISIPATSPAHHMELVSVKPIKHPKLLQYLAERGLKMSDVLQEKSDVFSFFVGDLLQNIEQNFLCHGICE